jgi:hypothetical protein
VKLLPCPTCDTGHASLDREGRVAYTLEVFPRVGREFIVKCQRCRRATALTVMDFNRLPDVPPADLERYGLLGPFARDLSLVEDQARDLAVAGFTLRDLQALGPPPTPS